MVDINAVGSSSFDPWTPDLDDDERRRAAAPPRTAAPPRDPSELYGHPDANGPLLARAAASPHLSLATGVRASDIAPVTDLPPVKQRMDAFKAAAKATYHLRGEGDVAVAARFRLHAKENLTPEEQKDPIRVAFAAIEKGIRARTPELLAVAANVGIRADRVGVVQVGRGTPEEVRRLTQGLIDAGKLPPPANAKDTREARVQRLMFEHGIGLDCAGYVQQAFTAAHGITRAQAGFAPNVADEGLIDPAATGPFRKVSPAQAQAGDIIALKAPAGERFGHRLLVFSRHDLQPDELASYKASDPKDTARLQSGRISIFEVDSSFGAGGHPDAGGVERQKWIYDAASNTWGRFAKNLRSPDDLSEWKSFRFTSSGLPYDGFHELSGVYHYQGGR